jgi:hypothetical protein
MDESRFTAEQQRTLRRRSEGRERRVKERKKRDSCSLLLFSSFLLLRAPSALSAPLR